MSPSRRLSPRYARRLLTCWVAIHIVVTASQKSKSKASRLVGAIAPKAVRVKLQVRGSAKPRGERLRYRLDGVEVLSDVLVGQAGCVRAKFTAKPGGQFVIRREALQRITRAFAAAGIKFAYPTVTIHASRAAAAPDEAPLQAAAERALRPAPANHVPMPA